MRSVIINDTSKTILYESAVGLLHRSKYFLAVLRTRDYRRNIITLTNFRTVFQKDGKWAHNSCRVSPTTLCIVIYFYWHTAAAVRESKKWMRQVNTLGRGIVELEKTEIHKIMAESRCLCCYWSVISKICERHGQDAQVKTLKKKKKIKYVYLYIMCILSRLFYCRYSARSSDRIFSLLFDCIFLFLFFVFTHYDVAGDQQFCTDTRHRHRLLDSIFFESQSHVCLWRIQHSRNVNRTDGKKRLFPYS